ncbi:MAG: right-handed parallel beta-helix repeat-containing protein [Planctomycetota bacterium]
MNPRHSTAVVLSFCLLVLVGVIVAGPLTPPAGPITQTDLLRTETGARIPLSQETAPGDAENDFIIASPGSYYLTENLNATGSNAAILISAGPVTLDLNGYLIDVPHANDVGTGVKLDRNAPRVTIQNGTIVGVEAGIDTRQNFSSLVRDVSIQGGNGVMAGSTDHIERVTVGATFVGFDSTSSLGTSLRNAPTFIDCKVVNLSATTAGFRGRGIFIRCVAEEIGLDSTGFDIIEQSQLVDCRAERINGTGFSISPKAPGTTLYRCVAIDAVQTGFDIKADGCTLTECHAVGSLEDGFSARLTRNVVFRDCLAQNNEGNGFVLGSYGLAERCVASSNGNGVVIPANSVGAVVRDCVANLNADTGFENGADAAMVIRNRAVDNGAFNFRFLPGAFGQYGEIVSSSGTISADPHANFSALSDPKRAGNSAE